MPTWARPIATSPISARSRLTAMLARLSMSTSQTSSRRGLDAEERLHRGPQRGDQTDDECPGVAVEGAGVGLRSSTRRPGSGSAPSRRCPPAGRSLPSSTKPRIVVATSSSGNTDRKPSTPATRRCDRSGGAGSRRACRRPRRRPRTRRRSGHRRSRMASATASQGPVDGLDGRASTSAALARLNGRLPKNPLWADSGDGCADSMIVWRVVSISGFFRRADAPHRMNTTCSGLASTAAITWSVNVSHPLPWCEAACPARTVSVALSSSTPWRAHASRLPWSGGSMPRSARELVVDVGERRRDADAALHREAQPVGLARPVVRILAEDQHACVGVRRQVEGGEHLSCGGYTVWRRRSSATNACRSCQYGLVELAAQDRVPVRRHDPVA